MPCWCTRIVAANRVRLSNARGRPGVPLAAYGEDVWDKQFMILGAAVLAVVTVVLVYQYAARLFGKLAVPADVTASRLAYDAACRDRMQRKAA